MSSNGISGMSNISTDTLQNRYEKSIKQYNKLIEINRQLKDNNSNNENQIKQMVKEINILKQQINQLDNQNNLMDEKYMQLTNSYQQLQIYSKKIQQQLANNDLKFRQYHQELQRQIEKSNIILKENQYIQNQYQQVLHQLQQKQQEIDNLQKINEQYQNNVSQINQEKKIIHQQNIKLKNTLKQENIQDLMLKLESAQINIEKLIKECNQLKCKEINSQISKEKQKMQKYITLNTNIQEQKEDYTISHLIFEYKSKIKHLQDENKHLFHKYKLQKSKFKDLQKDYQSKILNLQKLTQKQQKQIEKMIETYDKQLMNIHNQKKKIKEMYFEVLKKLTKRNQQSNMIQELRRTNQIIFHENESLKKINHSLKQQRQLNIKETASLKPNISNNQSIEMISKIPQLHEEKFDSKIKLKYSDIQTNYFQNHINHNSQQLPNGKTFYDANKANQKIPITLRYGNNQDGDKSNFKFIQSVNIINGFNVNLSQNSARSSS